MCWGSTSGRCKMDLCPLRKKDLGARGKPFRFDCEVRWCVLGVHRYNNTNKNRNKSKHNSNNSKSENTRAQRYTVYCRFFLFQGPSARSVLMLLHMFLARQRARQVLPAAILPTTVPHPTVHSDLSPMVDVVIRAHRPIQKAVLPVIRRQGVQINSFGCPALAF